MRRGAVQHASPHVAAAEVDHVLDVLSVRLHVHRDGSLFAWNGAALLRLAVDGVQPLTPPISVQLCEDNHVLPVRVDNCLHQGEREGWREEEGGDGGREGRREEEGGTEGGRGRDGGRKREGGRERAGEEEEGRERGRKGGREGAREEGRERGRKREGGSGGGREVKL